MQKSHHSVPRFGARTAGAQRLSGAQNYGGASRITTRFRKKYPFLGVGAHHWACFELRRQLDDIIFVPDNDLLELFSLAAMMANATLEYERNGETGQDHAQEIHR